MFTSSQILAKCPNPPSTKSIQVPCITAQLRRKHSEARQFLAMYESTIGQEALKLRVLSSNVGVRAPYARPSQTSLPLSLPLSLFSLSISPSLSLLSPYLTLSAQSHSLFTNSRHARVHQPPRDMQVVCDQLKHQSKHPDGQPSELILFPKLRIYFTDFPYRLCALVQRLLTLQTWLVRLWVRTGVRVGFSHLPSSSACVRG